MPRLLTQAKQQNEAATLPPKPVALFVGGTSGIGKASVEALARYAKGNIHIIIVGRNETAANQIISSLPQSPESNYEFVHCDVSLMSNISSFARSLSSRLTKLNYLFLSTGYLSTEAFKPTSEGIDQRLAVTYYSRFKFIQEFLPLLQEAKQLGEAARVVVVLASGHGKPLDLDNLGLKKKHTPFLSLFYGPACTELAVEEFAARNPAISFTHIHPGLVDTPILSNFWLTKYFVWIMRLLFLKKAEDCAEWMLCPLLGDAFESGAFHLNEYAEPVPPQTLHITPERQKAVYDHSVETVSPY
ncbi:NAD(P)-binding protein [Cantharellus anzutake]|uniref:NAD(P)-binding protein n=1 Tax=Cantharellus anzutake TaxID=1750568 RepID=UPI001903A46C|nr:NAD(P)-binding protein [Cantharellus anzutake]KAF8330898.1 NAD(P)-binding protein [Cantharellus anzutake]